MNREIKMFVLALFLCNLLLFSIPVAEDNGLAKQPLALP